jgi:hypothetical protein
MEEGQGDNDTGSHHPVRAAARTSKILPAFISIHNVRAVQVCESMAPAAIQSLRRAASMTSMTVRHVRSQNRALL